jgi:predicted Zn-dependent protease
MIQIDRKYLQVMMEAGYIFMGMHRFKEARAMFEGLAAIAPESEVPLVALGNVDFCENRLLGAIRHYKQALKLDPASVFAKVYMGEAIFFAGEREKGLELLAEVAKADRGGAGDFARALINAIKQGFEPPPEGKRGGNAS